jgi:hypothetical protein
MNVHDSERVGGTLVQQGYRQVETVEQVVDARCTADLGPAYCRAVAFTGMLAGGSGQGAESARQ